MKYFFVLILAWYFACNLNAQINFNLNLNWDSQPTWGPSGYDYVENYYLPEIDIYYNVPLNRFYYNSGGLWRNSSNLPSNYSNYDLYNSYKVVVNEQKPWLNHKIYRDKYASNKGQHDQQLIRDSRDSKYFVNKNHPEHNKWAQQQKQDKSNSKAIRQDNNEIK